MLTMGWTSLPTRWLHALRPRPTWSGGGVVVNKRKVGGGQASLSHSLDVLTFDWMPQTGANMAHPTRWVLVVQDEVGTLHAVFVAPGVWAKHRIGDHITAENPLVDIS